MEAEKASNVLIDGAIIRDTMSDDKTVFEKIWTHCTCFKLKGHEEASKRGYPNPDTRSGVPGKYKVALAFLVICVVILISLLSAIISHPKSFFFISHMKAPPCLTPECIQTAANLLEGMDRSADPCTDFFQFACGAWNKKHVIPEDRSSISTFEVLADQLQIVLKDILEERETTTDNLSTLKAKRFYHSCMNLTQIEIVDDEPLRAAIESLGGWPVVDQDWANVPGKTVPSVEVLLAVLKRKFSLGVIIEEWVGQDDKNSHNHIIQLDQMSFGLPSREYYLHEHSIRDLEAYHDYMTDVSVILGAERKRASQQFWDVLNFEKNLANISVAEVERIDTGAIYQKLKIKQLIEWVPEIDWIKYFSTLFYPLNVSVDEDLVSYSTPYFMELGKVMANTDKRVIHNYVIWRLVMDMMPHLPLKYQKARAEFRRILLGVLTLRNRWNQCVEWTNKKLGMAVGALFIKDNFQQENKQTALEMIHDIREAFNELLKENEWMDDETRLVAEEKANSMNERIGYPEYITDTYNLEEEYKNLEPVEKETFLANMFAILNFESERNVKKLRQPVTRDKWVTEPAVVNAFYNPNKNDIVIPAGILQPLFYAHHFPKSLNYGGIGVVIGHEITHGFDDKGRQFDKQGNLKQWWNNRTVAEFRQAAQCIIDQYSNYTLDDINLPIDGRLTQGENIADNGGLKQAFRAYKKWVERHGEEPNLPGLDMSHDQLFFLNYAQIWCGSMRPEDALTKIRSAVHSPGPIRVLGPLSNSRDFASAYNCPVGSRMNPVKKCSVW